MSSPSSIDPVNVNGPKWPSNSKVWLVDVWTDGKVYSGITRKYGTGKRHQKHHVQVYLQKTDEEVWMDEASLNLHPRTNQGKTPPEDMIYRTEKLLVPRSTSNKSTKSGTITKPKPKSSKAKTKKAGNETAEEKKARLAQEKKEFLRDERKRAKKTAEEKAAAISVPKDQASKVN